MKKMNENVKSVIVLTVICLIVTALLAVTNHFTAPIIKTARDEKIERSLKTVIPEMYSIRDAEIPEGAPSSVKHIYIVNDSLYAVVLTTTSAYSSGDMGITVGVSADGKVVGVTLTSYFESKDFGRDTYPKNYIGTTLEDYADVDTFAGVTYSSKAFRKAIGDALTAVKLLKGGDAQ
ncbi:MAG: FMN-binding protein [Clostridiales bacterium]|nr:FMN-binding protein [Clostridiales bacterium]